MLDTHETYKTPGITAATNRGHIARATVEAVAFQTGAVIDAMKQDSKEPLKKLAVDGGMTNGDACMEIIADIGNFSVIRPKMREWVTFS